MIKKIFWIMMLLCSLYSVSAITFYFNDSADVGTVSNRWNTISNQYFIYDSVYFFSPTKSFNLTGLASGISYNCTKMNPNTGNYSIEWKVKDNGMTTCNVMIAMEDNSSVTTNYYNTKGFNTFIGSSCPYGNTGFSLHDAYDNTYVNCGTIPVTTGFSNISLRWNRNLGNATMYVNGVYVCSKIMNANSLNVQCIKGWGHNGNIKFSMDDIQICDGLTGCSETITSNYAINLTLINSSSNNIISLFQEQLFYIRTNFTNNGITILGANCSYNASDMKATYTKGIANITLSTGNYDLNMSYSHGNSSEDSFIIRRKSVV